MTKKTNNQNVDVTILAAVIAGGGVASPGTVLNMPAKEAAGLVRRDRAEYFTGEKDILSLTKPELIELATSKGIETKGLTVPKLMDAIEAAESDGE